MVNFCLDDSDFYYLSLSDQPKRFDADSPVTNVFFDDTNGQVFTVRSGGVTGVTVNSMDESKCTSFRMEDKGPIISIKFSLDQKVLAIQRNNDGQSATVEFVNFKDLAPTNVEYSHTCKWKSAKILGFVWPKANEIAFITDHGIELLQVLPEKKQLKTLKSVSFSGAWFSWCAQSNIAVIAGNNGALLQPFFFNNSTITKLQKLELDSSRPVVERDVFILQLCDVTWCAVFRHGNTSSMTSTGPTEIWLMPISGSCGVNCTHILKTGLIGRFAISIVDDLIAVHHQSSQTSQLFDIMEDSKLDNNMMVHIPIVAGYSMKPAVVDDQLCPMYSGNWVVFQPNYIIDARLGCLWRVNLIPAGLAHSVPQEEISKIVAVLLRRKDGTDTVYRILNQLVTHVDTYLVELTQAFDEINTVYRQWAELEMARNTTGYGETGKSRATRGLRASALPQQDICARVLQPHAEHPRLVQVMTAYVASLCRHGLVVAEGAGALCVRALVTGGARGRLHALLRRSALSDSRPLACQLLSLAHLHPPAAQLALDMMWRLRAREEIVEVLLSSNEPVSAVGAARQMDEATWRGLPARKLLAAARAHAEEKAQPGAFVAVFHALLARNERLRGSPHFLKGEQCDSYIEYYKQVTAER
ncbi:regulator of MON1-CCZ1 complex [Battus philenor]|uniref:regulator of MON1-CCZ1 complex n=1 Tax=Battus philenor TaxID=42288 RepID=UPI0035D0D6ED